MKNNIHRFIEWMERSPAYKTIWFLPLLFALGIYAGIYNLLKGDNDNHNK